MWSCRAIGRAWFDWSWSVRLADKLRTATEARVLDGEAFAVFFTNPRLDQRSVQLDLRLIEADPAADILDLGCGPGLYAAELGRRGVVVTGVEGAAHPRGVG